MIKISKMADYALQLVLVLMQQPNLLSASKLASLTTFPEATVSKLLKLLTEANLLISLQGQKGGYQLAKLPDQITLADLIDVVDGPLALTECCKSDYFCPKNSVCDRQDNWRTVSNLIVSLLNNISLQDMASELPNNLEHYFLKNKHQKMSME